MSILQFNTELAEFLKFVIPGKTKINCVTSRKINRLGSISEPDNALDMFDAKDTHGYIINIGEAPNWQQIMYFFDPDTGESRAIQFNYQIPDESGEYKSIRYAVVWSSKSFPRHETWIRSFASKSIDGSVDIWQSRHAPIEKFNRIDEWRNHINNLLVNLDNPA